MKTKFKYFTIAFVALLMVGFSSCSSDDTPDIDTGETKSVFLKISNGPSTRAEGPAQDHDSSVEFTSGHLYFTTAAGAIQHYEAISDVSAYASGKTISNLPGNVEHVYVVGNTTQDSSGNALPTTGPISALKAKVLAVASQVQSGDVTKVNKVNLYGEALKLEVPTNVGDPYTAAVTVSPTVARIQLADIKSGGAITAFTVDAIYIDNYYAQAQVGGDVVTPSLVVNGPNANLFDSSHADYAYTGDAVKAIHDIVGKPAVAATAPATGFILKPASGVWGYNLFAESDGSDVPRIIIKLSGVEATGMTFNGPQFITIRGFKDNAKVLDVIKPGHVYTIGTEGLVFNESNLSPTPNKEPIDVEVTVEVAKWKAVSIEPIL